MTSEFEADDITGEDQGAKTPASFATAVTDPLRSLRLVKWLTRLFVYPGIAVLIPLDHSLWGLTWQQALSVHLGGFLIATIAIEAAFGQAFKLRKHAAYPNVLLVELGKVQTVAGAAQQALAVIHHLLGLRASFLALGVNPDVPMTAVSGMSRTTAQRFLQVGMSSVQEAMRTQCPVMFRSPGLVLPETMPGSDERLVFVPVVGLQQPIGVLALVGHKGNGDLKDNELLAGIGSALGLSLENLRQQEELRESEAKFRTLAETSAAATFIDQGTRFRYVNSMTEIITGYSREELLAMDLLDVIHPDFRELVMERGLARLRGEDVPVRYEIKIVTKSGDDCWVDVTTSLTEFEGKPAVLGTAFDITERKRAEETIRHQAYHDPLTDLPNRMLFEDRLNTALAQARRKAQMTAVMFLDLDRFKVVNDTVGHALGDRLLKGVGERLMGLVRDGDSVARVGGDEFTVLLPDVARPEDTVEVAERILDVLRQPWVLNGHEFHISTSIGIAMYPNDGEDAESLLRNADTAMYRAKDGGRDNYKLYTPTMNARIAERLALENSLRHGLERGEFVVYYQPQVDIGSGRIVGMEALVRWQHPEQGLISPAEFIPVAEETGLIVPLGAWVLRIACAQNKAWQEAGVPPMRMAVNLSARQFQLRDLIDTVAQVLEETRLDAQFLQLEITEGVAMQDVEFTVTMLRELREMGVQIAMDDFGTGHSSLSYLKRFPINILKIDQSFVRDLTVDPDDAAIASTIIMMAHNLKLKVIAEGVETEDQLAFLRERQCDEMQGYLFSKPAPAEAFEAMLRQGGDRPRARRPVRANR